MSSIFYNPAAFAPFYDTEAAFYGTRPGPRPVAATVKCCVFEGGFADPVLDDLNTSSTVRTVGLSFPVVSWPDETTPQSGERVVLSGGADFYVSNVERVLGDYHVTVKEGAAS